MKSSRHRPLAMRGVAGTLTAATAAVLVVAGATGPAGASTSDLAYFTVAGTSYVDFAQSATWARTGAGVTYTSFVSGPTAHQYAASKGRAFDEWGLWCEGSPVFSSYPEGATGFSCALPPRFSFWAQGVSYGYNPRSKGWNASFTKVTGYETTAAAVGSGGGAEAELSAPLAALSRASASSATPTVWPVNAYGESFGNAMEASSPQDQPVLMTATSVDGVRGYVRRSELEAADGTAAMNQGDGIGAALPQPVREDRTVAVYELDGRTEIGRYLLVGADTQERLARERAVAH